ncbi:ThiF family adenylyltransferase [Pseudomonas aeruginosa]|nr:ThiF family adenylyltransferase [Pseudomonas aeruginosa]MCG0442906.1 ThiF family adenylyltransferase [Pseudomonas aeruginosa]MDD1799888.1 ThiF family adenylyltransferase [Pseudomonas aeruginosa]WKY65565.1 ThiF family adenylyltransferase [Pseudomonas aeruginosa]WKY71434.1 ThiF family adenylyltransferase [Pseudomonas aeruginosa]WKY77312.1 ThiF family adenylyltransferase [Pseudomonas aeruginosa]
MSRTEYIVIDAGDGSVDAGNPGGIRRQERLAIGINPQYRVPILVHALRKDFPPLSHQHPRAPGHPRTLCLFDHDWSAVQISWTPERFIARMFWWLRESAQLKLHRDDQPLEQLFYMSPCQLILPANYADYAAASGKTLTFLRVGEGQSLILRAVPFTPSAQSRAIQVVSIAVPPVDSTTVVELPDTLGALQDQLEVWGSDLSKPLYDSVFEAIAEGVSSSEGVGEGLLILLWVPRTRQGEPERIDILGFLMTSSLFELAKAFDMLGPPDADGRCLRIALVGGQTGTDWRSLEPVPVEVRSALTANMARDLSAVSTENAQFEGVLAGLGALGGALADLWIRQGWGHWTFIDPDRLMPHNLSRHVAFDYDIGQEKVDVMQGHAARIYPDEPLPGAIAKSILSQDADVLNALGQAQLVVDVTTTLHAPRELARTANAPRTASLFLTPSGLSSVMILEDQARQQRVDGMEGQYYRAILNNEWGREHLANHLGDRWVGGGCRDISVRISDECIHVHAGILSRQLRQSVAKPEARLCVWAYDEQSGAIASHEVSLSEVFTTTSNGWTIKYDAALVDKLKQARLAALPNEIGGSIIGITDLKAGTLVIVDVLPTPPDSQSSPSHFIRGEKGQQEALEEVQGRTARVVDYLGEWHSHPDGVPARPSQNDESLLNTVHRKMSVEGLPALMVIVASNEVSFIVR